MSSSFRAAPTINLRKSFLFIQKLPNGPSSILDDADIDRQREGEIERQRSELGQLKERLALMCRQVPDSEAVLWSSAYSKTNKISEARRC